MGKEKMIVDIIKTSTNNLPSKVKEKDSVLRKIPFDVVKKSGLISEEEYNMIIPCIKEFQLDDPKNLIKWIVDIHFSGIESINANIACIRRDLLSSEVSKISAIRRKIIDLNESDDMNKYTKQYTDEMFNILSDLEGKVNNYLSEIVEIDNLPRYKFFVKANFNKSKVTAAVQLSKAALQAYFEAIDIYAVLSNGRNNNVVRDSTFDESIDFINKLDISYFIAYDKNKDTFWNKSEMKEKVENARKVKDLLNDFIANEQAIEMDFENDIIF